MNQKEIQLPYIIRPHKEYIIKIISGFLLVTLFVPLIYLLVNPLINWLPSLELTGLLILICCLLYLFASMSKVILYADYIIVVSFFWIRRKVFYKNITNVHRTTVVGARGTRQPVIIMKVDRKKAIKIFTILYTSTDINVIIDFIDIKR